MTICGASCFCDSPTLVPHRSCCLVNHSASPAACRTGRFASLAPLPRSLRCHVDPAALPTTVPRRPRAAQGVLPRRSCCHAVCAAVPTLLPRRPQCLAGRVSHRPCCHAAMQSALLHRPCCLADNSASQDSITNTHRRVTFHMFTMSNDFRSERIQEKNLLNVHSA
jgi:hypothetical protein